MSAHDYITAYHGTADIARVMAIGIRPYPSNLIIGVVKGLTGIWLTTDLKEAIVYAKAGLDERLARGRGGVVQVRMPKSWIKYSRTGGPWPTAGAEPNWYDMPEYSKAYIEGWLPDQPVEGQTWYQTFHEIPPSMLRRV